jgi:hypothetical protein
MSFEEILRRRLEHEARAVPLPFRDAGRAAHRARTRRRHRLAAAGAVTAAAVVAAAVPLVHGSSGDDSAVIPAATGLPATGPLQLAWSSHGDGLSELASTFQAADGSVYALSTGPGVRYGDWPDGMPKALYHLADDGTWQPTELDGDRPRAIDVAGNGSDIYAVSTGPATSGDEFVSRLSASADGGDTWTTEDLPAAEPPSTVLQWDAVSNLSVETAGSTTLALVATSFLPDVAALFPEMATDLSRAYQVRYTDEGITLMSGGREAWVLQAGPGATTPPTRPGDAEEQPTQVRTVPWSELGVDGPEALGRNQFYRRAGDAWEPIDTHLPGTDVSLADLGEAAGKFVLSGSRRAAVGGDEAAPVLYVSDDGAAWNEVQPPGELGQIVGVGSALVNVPWQGSVLQVSTDAGASWTDVDLAAAGVPVAADSVLMSPSGGPLGLAFVIGADDQDEGTPQQLVTSSDLASFTTTPLSDVFGAGAEGWHVFGTFMGTDRVVVLATPPTQPGQEVNMSTAVGTPVRDG